MCLVSILVHEFGHGLTARALLGSRPSVLLYWMGGLCVYDNDNRARNLKQQAIVLLMGPMAGFLLMGIVLLVGLVVFGELYYPVFDREASLFFRITPWQWHDPMVWLNQLPPPIYRALKAAYLDLFLINLFWGVFNLLPIFPLDGGQITQVFLTMHDRNHGARRSYIVGLVTAGGAGDLCVHTERNLQRPHPGLAGLIKFSAFADRASPVS